MVPEVLSALEIKTGGSYIDANLGEGGHTEAILRASSPNSSVLGIDADTEAIESAVARLSAISTEFANGLTTANANFRDIKLVASENRLGEASVDGILFDLGLSSLQLDTETRGFSFRRPDPLDMRFDVRQTTTAADIVNRYQQDDLADVIYQYGEERASRRIAAAIVAARPLQVQCPVRNQEGNLYAAEPAVSIRPQKRSRRSGSPSTTSLALSKPDSKQRCRF
jgi:16S rRNA (cytosine1402-N4)-methyltransferase